MRLSILYISFNNHVTFMLLLELDKELRIEFYLVIYMLLSSGVLLSSEWRRVLKVYTAVLTIEVGHVYNYKAFSLLLLLFN
jgi:hypothetical protein